MRVTSRQPQHEALRMEVSWMCHRVCAGICTPRWIRGIMEAGRVHQRQGSRLLVLTGLISPVCTGFSNRMTVPQLDPVTTSYSCQLSNKWQQIVHILLGDHQLFLCPLSRVTSDTGANSYLQAVCKVSLHLAWTEETQKNYIWRSEVWPNGFNNMVTFNH